MKIEYGSACALSHILVIEKFLKTDKKYQIILEDDFKIINNFNLKKVNIDSLIKNINRTYSTIDILYLNNRTKRNYLYQVVKGWPANSHDIFIGS